MHPRWHILEHTNRSLLQKVQVTHQMVGYHAPKPTLTERQDAGLGPSSLALNASSFLQYGNRCTDRKIISSYTKSLLFLYKRLLSLAYPWYSTKKRLASSSLHSPVRCFYTLSTLKPNPLLAEQSRLSLPIPRVSNIFS